jgi:hypothetical protein
MSQEDNWKVYETNSPLYNLLWSWMIDDKGATIYETEDGDEKYEGLTDEIFDEAYDNASDSNNLIAEMDSYLAKTLQEK